MFISHVTSFILVLLRASVGKKKPKAISYRFVCWCVFNFKKIKHPYKQNRRTVIKKKCQILILPRIISKTEKSFTCTFTKGVELTK